MLNDLFTSVYRMGITGSITIIIVILLRYIFRKLPRKYSYILWLIVFFRLICPFTLESPIGIFDKEIVNNTYGNIEKVINLRQDSDALNKDHEIIKKPKENTNYIDYIQIISLIWFLGLVILTSKSIFSYIKFKKVLSNSSLLYNNIYRTTYSDVPFVLGIIKPKIYIPFDINDDDIKLVLLHEKIHIKRLDYISRLLAYLITIIHWFNPLVWLAYRLSGEDMEMSCDEKVIDVLGNSSKKKYSASILSIASGQNPYKSSNLITYTNNNTKKRIHNILKFRNITREERTFVILLIVGLFLVLGLNSESHDKSFDYNSLIEYRTKYIGNASSLGNIASRLENIPGSKYGGISLKTDKVPYGVTVNLIMDKNTFDNLDIEKNTTLKVNACLIFALVENADFVIYKTENKDGEIKSIKYDFRWAEELLDMNLYDQSQSQSKFENFLFLLENEIR